MYSSICQWAVLSKNFVAPNAPPSLREADSWTILTILPSFVRLLRSSLWTPEFEHALDNFSLGAFLDYVENLDYASDHRDKIAPEFFSYLEANVSFPSSQRKCQLQLIILIRTDLTSIALMPPATWNMRCSPSTVTPAQRNSTS
jgi:hypothetical protein